jgi:3-hydroxyisobutyrate dehydrogenase-like beta-hydroxyacid dehydrogenase
MNVGFIGLGTMGTHMARHVQAALKPAGDALFVYDLRRTAAEPHIAQGASFAETPRAIAERCDVIFTSLPGPPEVEAVATGSDGLIAGIRPGAAYFDLTTNSVSLVRRLHAEFLGRGTHMLDAPVSGGPAGAASAKLALWVSGEEDVFNKHLPLLAAIGDQPKYIGPIGAGTVAKLVHNCAGYIINTGLAEVFALGVKAGVDPLDLWQAVRQGALGRRRTFDMLAGHFLPGKFDPANFALRLAHKDVGLAVALGRELGVPMRLANLTLEEMTEAMDRGWAERDSRVAMTLELERAGVTIQVDAERLRAATASEQA